MDNQRDLRAPIVQFVVLLMVAAAAFFATVTFMKPSQASTQSRSTNGHAKLTLGEYTFSYPKRWQTISDPATFTALPKVGVVRKGLCAATAEGSCTTSNHVAYMLFEQPGKMASINVVVKQLRTALPQQLQGFGHLSVQSLKTKSGIPYAVLNFQFTKGVVRQESVAIYRDVNGEGAVAVATGPSAEFAQTKSSMDEIFASAVIG